MEFDVRSTTENGACVVSVEGEIDVYTAPRLKEVLVDVIEGGCPNVVVDLDRVSFIDSSGLGVLVGALRRAKEASGSLRLVCTRDGVLKIFRITGLDKVFPIFSSVSDASAF